MGQDDCNSSLATQSSDSSANCADFDDRRFWHEELEKKSTSWRTETYAEKSSVLILDHDKGKSNIRYCGDEQIGRLLDPKKPRPQVRFILLEPTPQERVLGEMTDSQKKEPLANELINANTNAFTDIYGRGQGTPSVTKSQLNVSQVTLRKILLTHDIAPATASHVRGQEQIFGSRIISDDSGNESAFEFWYAIRARAYFRELRKEADLKMTIITRYDVKSQKSIILLKYRSYNDLPSYLQTELIEKLKELVRQPSTTKLADNPFALSLFHFSSTIQYYRRAARDPRDTIRNEEKKVHEKSDAVDLRMIHLALASLDQDKIQLNFILELINQLRKQHDRFFRKVKKIPNPDERGWSYVRVEEDLDRFENQVTYFRNSVQDVAGRAQRLLDLLFNLSSAKVAEQAMYESASMSTISVVTMLFLPGSFVAGILGTNLFTGPTKPDSSSRDISTSGGRGLYVSDQWWLLLAVIGPVTLLTFMGWHMWKKFTRLKIRRKLLMAEIV